MKRIASLFLALCPAFLFAQISITANDLPDANQGYLISTVTNPLSVDPGMGGANQTWDFSMLPSDAVELDTFVTVGSTPSVLSLVFNNFLDQTHRSDYAQYVEVDSIFGVPIEGLYYFYKDASSSRQLVGIGVDVGQIPIPVLYNPVDDVYDLPLTYGQVSSSYSAFEFNLPTIGFVGTELTRATNVDGWGSITTPNGTYDALRVVQELQYVDTIALDTLGGGTSITRPLETHYIWLAVGEGVPVLEITTQTIATAEVVSSVRWKGAPEPLAICDCLVPVHEAYLFPNPAGTAASIWLGIAPDEAVEAQLLSLDGKVVRQYQLNNQLQNISLEGVRKGVYLLRMPGFEPQRVVITG